MSNPRFNLFKEKILNKGITLESLNLSIGRLFRKKTTNQEIAHYQLLYKFDMCYSLLK